MLGSHRDDGLAVWAARDRTVRNQDLVVWINLGMRHLTRAEDLRVTPTCGSRSGCDRTTSST